MLHRVLFMENVIGTIRELKEKLSKNATAVFCSTALLFILLITVAYAHTKSVTKLKEQELQNVNSQCEAQEAENAALVELLENSDDEFYEHIVRGERDYVRPGERVYIVRSGN